MIKTGYKRTGNIVVDKVSACIDFYASQGRPLSRVVLDKTNWNYFANYAVRVAEGCIEAGDKIDFDGVTIQKGSDLMTKDMYWEFKIMAEA